MIKLSHIQKTFNPDTINQIELYSDLNLHIKEGEFITVIGSNGSGKSTLFNLICGNVIQDSGIISLNETDISQQQEHLRNKQFSRVYQDPSKGVAPSLTILENLSMAHNKGKPYNLTKAVDKKDVSYFKELLQTLDLGLEDKLNVAVSTLSGGQRQALTLLMATMNNPKLLLLDEHTAALDPKTSELIIQLTDKIVHQKKITTLMITHNLKHALTYGDRLIMLHKGIIVLDISGEEKSKLTVQELIEQFNRLKLTDSLSDEMLLA